MSNAPCFGCTDRHVSCHSTCQKYAEWGHKLNTQREAIRAEKQKNNRLRSYSIDLAEKIRRAKQ